MSPDSDSPESLAKFTSPMPEWEDGIGPRFIPFWQTALAALAALSSIAFAVLLFQKL